MDAEPEAEEAVEPVIVEMNVQAMADHSRHIRLSAFVGLRDLH